MNNTFAGLYTSDGYMPGRRRIYRLFEHFLGRGQDERKSRASRPAFDPDLAKMLGHNHFADGQPQPRPRPSLPSGIGSVLFKNSIEMFVRNTRPGILNIDPVRVKVLDGAEAALPVHLSVNVLNTPVPKIGIAPYLDPSISGREFAGIVEQVDHNLLDLRRFE
jgi:hypothetical protein